jgi:hypothetical protein
MEEPAVETPRVEPKSPIAEALRNEVIRLATEGDPKRDGTFSVEIAARIERIVLAGRNLLMAERLSAIDADHLIKRQKKNIFNNMNYDPLGDYTLGNDESFMAMGAPMMGSGSPLAVSGPSENFGMHAIREMVNAAKTMKDTPEALVSALALARKEDLHDVAADLERRLGISSPSPVSPPPATKDNAAALLASYSEGGTS